jgi:hypothetical protein
LRLLNENQVDYLLIGGYAVGNYGYVRPTADMDVWIAMRRDNAERLVHAFRQFGLATPAMTPDVFLEPGHIIRMGVPPLQLEIHTTISGVEFDDAFGRRTLAKYEGVTASMISREDLVKNKRASGRPKVLVDVSELER